MQERGGGDTPAPGGRFGLGVVAENFLRYSVGRGGQTKPRRRTIDHDPVIIERQGYLRPSTAVPMTITSRATSIRAYSTMSFP
jgi:hypothetical protein